MRKKQTVELGHGRVFAVSSGSPAVIVNERVTTQCGDEVMFADKYNKQLAHRESLRIGKLSKDLEGASTPSQAVAAALKNIDADDTLNRVVLQHLSDVWLEAEGAINPEERFKKGFLLVLEKDWGDCSSPRVLLESIQRRMSENIPHDSKLLVDAATVILLKSHFPHEPVRESLPKYRAGIGA